jgi:hypothetical protein
LGVEFQSVITAASPNSEQRFEGGFHGGQMLFLNHFGDSPVYVFAAGMQFYTYRTNTHTY